MVESWQNNTAHLWTCRLSNCNNWKLEFKQSLLGLGEVFFGICLINCDFDQTLYLFCTKRSDQTLRQQNVSIDMRQRSF